MGKYNKELGGIHADLKKKGVPNVKVDHLQNFPVYFQEEIERMFEEGSFNHRKAFVITTRLGGEDAVLVLGEMNTKKYRVADGVDSKTLQKAKNILKRYGYKVE